MPKKDNEIKEISWVEPEQGFVKFEGDDEPCSVTDKVGENLNKYPLNEGDKVEVGIADEEDEDGNKVVTFIRKTQSKGKKATKKPTKKTEESDDKETKQGKLAVFYHKTKSVVFEGENDVWYTLSDKVYENLKKMKVGKGTEVEATVVPKENGNDLITFAKVVQNSTPQAKKKTNQSSGTNSKDDFYTIKRLENRVRYLENNEQESIELQSSNRNACDLIGQLFAGKFDPDDKKASTTVKKMIKSLTEYNYNTVQELKSNEEVQ